METPDIAKPAIKEQWRELFLVVFAAVILYFPFLGKRDLWTPGEARVTQVAVQMVRSGDWVVPHLGNDLRIAKPPLSYWLVCLTSPFNADNIDEEKSRIPSAVAGVLAALIIALWARETIGGYGGLLAGIAFVSTSACWWQARNSTIEMTLLFSTVAALYCWWRYHKGKSSIWLYLTYLAAALAALDKGPVTPPLILLIIVIYLISSSLNPFRLDIKAHLKGIILFFAVTLPWAVAVTLRVGKNAEGNYITVNEWFYQSAGRFKGFDHIKEIWYFLPKILGDGQPWIFFALIGLLAFFFYRKSNQNPAGLRFFAVWAIVTFIFFSIPASKKSYYILPIYPAFAVLAAWVINGLLSGFFKDSKTERATSAFCEFFGSTLVFTGLTLPFVSDIIFERFQKLAKYSGYVSEIMTAAAFSIIAGFLLCYAGTKKRWRIVPVLCFCSAAVAFNIHSLLLDKLNAHKGDRAFCLEIKDRLNESDVVYTYAMGGQPVYRYYLDRHVQRIINPAYLAYALHNLPEGDRLILGLDERDWLKFNNFYLLFYDAEKVEYSSVCEVVKGLKVRYPKSVEIFVSSSREGKSFAMVQLGPDIPKKNSPQEKWDAWQDKEKIMKSEIYETVKRLKSMGVEPIRMSVFFNEFSHLLESGRLWVEYDSGREKKMKEIKQESTPPETDKKEESSEKQNDDNVKKADIVS
ncbi:MAG: glycosyltransferase family 39 protein [Planctomycetota bacterium]